MAVGTYALTSTDEVFAFLGSDAQRDAFWVYYSGANATATVQVKENSIDFVDSGTTTRDLTSASYDTLAELVADINNNISGWEAGLIYHGSALSVDLVTTGALDAKGLANEQTLQIKDIYLIERLADRATDFIERWCNRKLVSRDYTAELYWGNGHCKLILDQYPVTRVMRLRRGRSNSFSIVNSSTDADFCTVEVTSTTIRLIVDGGTNADDTALTLSTYTSIDALITAIHALAKGWTCTTLATDTSYRDASELLERPSMAVTATVSAYIEVVDEDITDYKLMSYDADRNEGIIKKATVFQEGTEYFVNYTGGFTTTPAALEEACIRLVAYRYGQSKRADSGDLKKEQLGDYSYEKFGLAEFKGALPPDLIAEIELFKKVVI